MTKQTTKQPSLAGKRQKTNSNMNLTKGIIAAMFLAVCTYLFVYACKCNAQTIEILKNWNTNSYTVLTPENTSDRFNANQAPDPSLLTDEEQLQLNIEARTGRPQAEKGN